MEVARGKYLSLEEARRMGRLDQFCKEHPSQTNTVRFEALLDAMCRGEPPPKRKAKAVRTSRRGDDAC